MQVKALPSDGHDARRRYDDLVARLAHRADVEQKGRGFGGSALKVRGKMFATLSSRGLLVVKLPRKRVQSLVTSGDGRPFEPRPGRVMKEWLELDPRSRQDWVKLADEARSFVVGS